MHRMDGSILMKRVVLCGFFVFLLVGPACGKSEGPQGARTGAKQWTRIEVVGRWSFAGQVAEDEDLSGIACISDRFGLIGADEARDVQAVELSRQTRTLRVLETDSLARSGEEIDTEAIAAEGDCYYIIGSHGISKKEGEIQGNRFSIFRLKVDPATGRPVKPVSVETASLVDILRTDPVLGEHFGKPLQQRGVNIEGLAVRNGRLFVGLRGPNLGGDAFVLELRADDVFAGRPRPTYVLHRLRLGAGFGIREIVAAKSSFLIIAGNSASEPSEKYTESMDYDAGSGVPSGRLGRQGPGCPQDRAHPRRSRQGGGHDHPGRDGGSCDGPDAVRRSQAGTAHRLSDL